MRFVNPIPFVRDIARSRAFYTEVLDLTVLQDHGEFVLFEGGFALHAGPALETTIWGHPSKSPAPYGRQNLLLYFEVADIDGSFDKIAPHVTLIHPIENQAWGQRVFRFYDPDGHAIEVGEPVAIETAS